MVARQGFDNRNMKRTRVSALRQTDVVVALIPRRCWLEGVLLETRPLQSRLREGFWCRVKIFVEARQGGETLRHRGRKDDSPRNQLEGIDGDKLDP